MGWRSPRGPKGLWPEDPVWIGGSSEASARVWLEVASVGYLAWRAAA
jgi:hypothetical protein